MSAAMGQNPRTTTMGMQAKLSKSASSSFKPNVSTLQIVEVDVGTAQKAVVRSGVIGNARWLSE